MNYNIISTLFGTRATQNGEKSKESHDLRDREQPIAAEATETASTSSMNIAPLSSLSIFSSMHERNSRSSMSCASLPSLTSSPTSIDTSRGREDKPIQCNIKNKKRRGSTSMISIKQLPMNGEKGKIRVSCNDCYQWRRKCLKQEAKLKELESELNRAKLQNMELSNKFNLETKTFNLKKREMDYELSEYKRINNELKQQKEDQVNKMNDMKQENDAIKQEMIVLNERNKHLHDDIQETQVHGRQLLSVINKLKERVIKIQTQIKKEEYSVRKDIKNPWYAVLKMT